MDSCEVEVDDQGFTLLWKKTQGECNSLLFLRGRAIACCISPAQWTSLPRHPDHPFDYALLTAATSLVSDSLASPKSMIVLGS
jgi:hypothetical protein